MIYVEHHKCYILILIVVITALVSELSLDLDDAVKGLVGDQLLVPDVQLEQRSRVGLVDHSIVLSGP